MANEEFDYSCERRLKELDKDLHDRYRNSVCVMMELLSRYQLLFPDFTDHTILHSTDVVYYCNRIIAENYKKLNADELYVLLMSCYLHDTGMGVSEKDFVEFSGEIDFGNYFDTHDREDRCSIVRAFHNEFSGEFIKKYADLFDIPSRQHVHAIVQISRGHRKMDLYDENQIPAKLTLENGNDICLPYLTGVMRLADESDVTKARNPAILYDTSKLTKDNDIREFSKHEAIKDLKIEKEKFVMTVDAPNEKIFGYMLDVQKKIQSTLDYVRTMVEDRTSYKITQTKVELVDLKKAKE